ncbi:hypothetical protein A5659_03605 [Mycobacterium sp. 1165196.3]|nr:hypothetical protein A5659_03605 [Mycobacterium sp. 1165196.3]
MISAGLSLVPYVGGALSTVYDAVDERRRYRIESTAREIAAAVGEERMLARLTEDPRLEPLIGNALDAAARTGFEAKRRLLGRAVANALLDEAAVDLGVLKVAALSQLEPVHVRALVALELAVERCEDNSRGPVEEFNKAQPVPIHATLQNTGVVMPATGYFGTGIGAYDLSPFGRELLAELRAVADEEFERLVE